jgi:heptosyltransferase-3
VGHDSGPLHLAAASGVACVGLFGALNKPRKWYPFGVGHRILHDLAGVDQIPVAAVLEAVTAMLAPQAASRPPL